MAKNLILGLILARLSKFGPQKVFSWVLLIQFQGKRMIQTQENDKKPHFGPDIGPLGPNLSS